VNAITELSTYQFDIAAVEQDWNAILNKITGFYYLEADWDGEGAESPPPELIASLIPYLDYMRHKEGSRVPDRALATPEGGIILEWQYEDGIFELESDSPGEAELMWAPDQGEAEFTHLKWVSEKNGDEGTLWGGWGYSPEGPSSIGQFACA
jgi:hypothetical protein